MEGVSILKISHRLCRLEIQPFKLEHHLLDMRVVISLAQVEIMNRLLAPFPPSPGLTRLSEESESLIAIHGAAPDVLHKLQGRILNYPPQRDEKAKEADRGGGGG